MSPSTPTPGVEFVSWDVWHASRRRTLDVVWLSAVGSALAWHASAHARSWEHVACVAAFVMLLLAGSRTHLYCKVRPQTLAAIRLATVLFAYLCGTSKDAAGSDLCWSTVPVSHWSLPFLVLAVQASFGLQLPLRWQTALGLLEVYLIRSAPHIEHGPGWLDFSLASLAFGLPTWWVYRSERQSRFQHIVARYNKEFGTGIKSL
ncbi:hypothetical protein V8C86DRAFT_2828950 [Haematococcus lacustris]